MFKYVARTNCVRRLAKKFHIENVIITYKIDIVADLKAFERRLTEVIACLHPSTTRWRSNHVDKSFMEC